MSAVALRPALAIEGMTSRLDLAWLAERARQADVVVEVGCYQGRSTRALADACGGVVYAVDTWDGPCLREDGTETGRDWGVWRAFARHLRHHIASGRVVPMQTSSTEAARVLAGHRVQVDLAFIDADHRKAGVAADLAALRPLMRPGGLMAGHDYHNARWPGVAQAVQEAFGDAVQVYRSIWWVRV
jgi:predicted O-methyltransferase YrrM